MLRHIKDRSPKLESTPTSMLAWSGYLFSLAIGAVLVQLALQMVIGLLALGAVGCLVLALVLAIINKFTK